MGSGKTRVERPGWVWALSLIETKESQRKYGERLECFASYLLCFCLHAYVGG